MNRDELYAWLDKFIHDLVASLPEDEEQTLSDWISVVIDNLEGKA